MQSIVLTQKLSQDRNPALIYIASLPSPQSRRVMSTALNNIAWIFGVDAAHLDWTALRYQHVMHIRAALLQSSWKPATTNRHLAALRGVLRESWRLGYLSAEEYQKAVDFKNIKAENLPAGRGLEHDELKELLQECDNTTTGIRDAAIIAVLYLSGLRRAEVISLNLGDLDTTGALLVHGKGRKERKVYIVNKGQDYLQRWLELRGTQPGPLFCQTRGGKIIVSPLTSQAVYIMLRRKAEKIGLDPLSPHDLRRSFISDLLDRGADIATVAKLAGHSDIKTTSRYDRRPEAVKRAASELLDLP